MATWYYAKDGAQQGPVEASEIERLISTGANFGRYIDLEIGNA